MENEKLKLPGCKFKARTFITPKKHRLKKIGLNLGIIFFVFLIMVEAIAYGRFSIRFALILIAFMSVDELLSRRRCVGVDVEVAGREGCLVVQLSYNSSKRARTRYIRYFMYTNQIKAVEYKQNPSRFAINFSGTFISEAGSEILESGFVKECRLEVFVSEEALERIAEWVEASTLPRGAE